MDVSEDRTSVNVEVSLVKQKTKPMGRPAYGSIGHLPGSRLGSGDHHVHAGQAVMCTTTAPKDRQVWVETKLDGSCVAAWWDPDTGQIVPLGRAGYTAISSPYEMHHLWHDWALKNQKRIRMVIEPGQRLVGEWLAQAHGTIYNLEGREPFVAFDIMKGSDRLTRWDFWGAITDTFAHPDVVSGPYEPEAAIGNLDSYGADEPEGVIYRVERKDRVDFLAKYVRPDKTDGSYLDDNIWNWRP